MAFLFLWTNVWCGGSGGLRPLCTTAKKERKTTLAHFCFSKVFAPFSFNFRFAAAAQLRVSGLHCTCWLELFVLENADILSAFLFIEWLVLISQLFQLENLKIVILDFLFLGSLFYLSIFHPFSVVFRCSSFIRRVVTLLDFFFLWEVSDSMRYMRARCRSCRCRRSIKISFWLGNLSFSDCFLSSSCWEFFCFCCKWTFILRGVSSPLFSFLFFSCADFPASFTSAAAAADEAVEIESDSVAWTPLLAAAVKKQRKREGSFQAA